MVSLTIKEQHFRIDFWILSQDSILHSKWKIAVTKCETPLRNLYTDCKATGSAIRAYLWMSQCLLLVISGTRMDLLLLSRSSINLPPILSCYLEWFSKNANKCLSSPQWFNHRRLISSDLLLKAIDGPTNLSKNPMRIVIALFPPLREFDLDYLIHF